MELEKRKIIVKEINHWRRSKLLPEQYCDFLSNLYMDEQIERISPLFGVSSTRVKNSSWKAWLVVLGIFSLISFTLLNFNSFPVSLQIGLSAFFVILCYLVVITKRRSRPVMSYIILGIGSCFLLFIGPYLLKLGGVEDPLWLVGYIGLCSLVWLCLGLSARIGLLHFCGWMGLVLFYSWLLHQEMEHFSWIYIQLYWVPIGMLFGWVGWLLHHKDKAVAVVFFLVACILWLFPELYSLVMTDLSESVIQTSILGKVAATGIVLFAFRKKWIEWVM